MYLQSVPYMQFPLLLAGKPVTGQPCEIPGVQFAPASDDFWTQRLRQIWKFYQEHPDGPFSYGGWDSVPGRPDARKTYAEWLKQYAPIVEEGTWAWLQITDSQLFRSPLPANVVASVFANRNIYLVLANYGSARATLETTDNYTSCKPELAVAGTHWELAPRSLHILKMQPVPPGTSKAKPHPEQ